MKKQLLPFLLFSCAISSAHGQGVSAIFKKGSKNDSSAFQKVIQVFGKNKMGVNLSTEEIAAGLRQALQVGAERATGKLSVADGFFKDAALKILMPEEAKKLESTLRSLGMGAQVDQAILSMNRAAEDAAGSATAIFVQAVKEMTIQDAAGILRGNDMAATGYLREKTSAALVNAFQPIIDQSLKKVNATKHWSTVTTTYNTVSRQKINTDLVAYVTEKALNGIFLQLGQEEKKIRKDPAARTTELLRKVFAQ